MNAMEETQKLDLGGPLLEKLQQNFSSARITDDEMCKTMNDVYTKFQYFIDPHTAVAVCAAEQNGYSLEEDDDGTDSTPFAILSTGE